MLIARLAFSAMIAHRNAGRAKCKQVPATKKPTGVPVPWARPLLGAPSTRARADDSGRGRRDDRLGVRRRTVGLRSGPWLYGNL